MEVARNPFVEQGQDTCHANSPTQISIGQGPSIDQRLQHEHATQAYETIAEWKELVSLKFSLAAHELHAMACALPH